MSELDKIAAARDESMTLSAFLDWLEEAGYCICEYTEMQEEHPAYAALITAGLTGKAESLPPYFVERWMPKRATHEKLLADYFDIDLNKAEDERLALLEDLRKQHEQKEEETA